MKINAVLVDPQWPGSLHDMGTPRDNIVQASGYIDLLMEGKTGWKTRQFLFDAIDSLGRRQLGENWSSGRATTVFGQQNTAIAAAVFMGSQNAAVSVAGPSNNKSAALASAADARHLPWSSVHAVHADTIIIADDSVQCGMNKGQLNPSLIREGNTVIDLSKYPNESAFAEEARARGAKFLSPKDIFTEQLRLQFKALTNMELPATALTDD